MRQTDESAAGGPTTAGVRQIRVNRVRPILVAAACLVAGFATPAPAQESAHPAYIVVEVDGGRVVDDAQSNALWQPASLTKIMTAYLTFKALHEGKLTLTSPVVISKHALAQAPAKMGYKVGTVINVDNALKMMLVKSANDIAVAVAETVGGSEPKFVAMMNAEAKRLGMTSTHYDNANGLPDDGQRTTARDLAVLARAIWTDFPEYREYYRIPAIKAGKHILRSQNMLLERYRGTVGMKTGFVCASGFNIVAVAQRADRTMIAVVLGAESPAMRGELAAHLLDEGFASWLSVGKASLDKFNAVPASGSLADLHDVVCPKKRDTTASDEEPPEDQIFPHSSLVPRFTLMDPVPVYTGRADAPGKVAGTSVPMPHLRPTALAGGAASAYVSPEKAIQLETR